MNVQVDIRYSLSEALKALGQESNIQPGAEVIVFSAADKFFVGGGCEANSFALLEEVAAGVSQPRNVSVCLNSPLN